MTDIRDGLLRTLAFHHTWGHAPTRPEWIATLECPVCSPQSAVRIEDVDRAIDGLVEGGVVASGFGRYAFDARVITAVREREHPLSRKRRIARRTASWLASLSSVRFVALCNATALGHAREGGDLDFFVVTRAGMIMATRAAAVLPYKLTNRRPTGDEDERDAICLSYFVSDDGLDLSSHMLDADDPYFRYWFLSLLPLYDDGVGKNLWSANAAITTRYPFAEPWIISPDLEVHPSMRVPIVSAVESLAARFQHRAFPASIRELMNRDTRVLVSPTAVKLHVNDRREEFRKQYRETCAVHGIAI